MEKPLDRYFQVRSPYYQKAKSNQKTRIPVPQVTGQVCQSQKNDKHQPNSNRWGATLVNVKHLLDKAFL